MRRHPVFDCALQKICFFSNLLHEGYDLRLRVTGKSMAPFLRTDSVVTLSRVPVDALRLGDIIFFTSIDETLTLHRLIGIKKEALVTKGDALMSPDIPVPKKNYLGKVTRIEHPGAESAGGFNMDRRAARVFNCLIAVYFRLKLSLRRRYAGFKTAVRKFV